MGNVSTENQRIFADYRRNTAFIQFSRNLCYRVTLRRVCKRIQLRMRLCLFGYQFNMYAKFNRKFKSSSPTFCILSDKFRADLLSGNNCARKSLGKVRIRGGPRSRETSLLGGARRRLSCQRLQRLLAGVTHESFPRMIRSALFYYPEKRGRRTSERTSLILSDSLKSTSSPGLPPSAQIRLSEIAESREICCISPEVSSPPSPPPLPTPSISLINHALCIA